MTSTGARVRVRGLTWTPAGRTTPVLCGLDLDIAPGERVLLAGPSGAGKSTLVRALAGVLLTADTGDLVGEVVVDGELAGARAGQSGLLLQDPADAVVAARAGRDVAFGPENIALQRDETWARVFEALAAVQFPYAADHPSAALSGGEGQRLALAGAIALGPGLLLLDEPTAMLDPAAATEVRRAVLDVVDRSGATLVVVEHHLGPWLDAVDRLVVLSDRGQILADGPPAQTLADRHDALAEAGLWLPDLPAPQPMSLPSAAASPWRTPIALAGDVLLQARSVVVRRTSRVAGQPFLETLALDGVAAELVAGRILAVTGASGSGKSTLLGVLGGLDRVSAGEVVAGSPLIGPGEAAGGPAQVGRRGLSPDPARWSSPELAARVAWVPQHPEHGFVARTVREEVLAGVPGEHRAMAAARAEALLSALGLVDQAGADPYHLSGGEQRRLALAASLAQGSSVLLLDEPTLGQDRHTWAAVAGAVKAARDGGVAVAVATHDELLVSTLADDRLDLSAPAGIPGSSRADPAVRRWPPVTRCGPLSILATSLCALAGSFAVRDWRVGLITLIAQLLLAPLAVRRVRESALRVVPGLLAAASIGWSSWLLGGHELGVGVGAGLRILTLVLPGALLTAYLEPSRLGDALAQQLRLPARPVVAAVAALLRLDQLGADWSEAAKVRRVRGLGAGRSPVSRIREAGALTFVLLVQALRRSGRMAVAMDARGFAGAAGRTWAEPARWARADSVLLGAGLILAALPVALTVSGALVG